jgi:O-antigen/teichoic acid export membrane protein
MPILNTTEYNSAIPLFNILMIGVGISYITAPNVGVMMASRKHKLMCFFAFIAFLINLAGNYFFIPVYGALAASVTTVVSQTFLNISCTLAIILQSKDKMILIKNHINCKKN